MAIGAPAWANPVDELGLGARSVALGGAMTSVANDFSAGYYNPAGLAEARHLSLSFGYALDLPQLEINDADLGVDSVRGVEGGLVLPGELLDRRVAVSVGMFLPDGLISRVRSIPQSQPRFVRYDNRPQRIVIGTSLAVELLDGLYLGAGLTYMTNTRGVLDLEGKVNLSDSELTRLDTALNVDFEATRYASFGLRYLLGDHWAFGVVFRDEFVLQLDLSLNVRGDITLSEEQLVLVEDGAFLFRSFNTNLFSPRQLVFGASYRGDSFLISFDLGWHQWSRFPAPVSTISLDLDLGDLDFAVPLPEEPLDPHFSDLLVPRLGGELDLFHDDSTRIVARAGYAFEATPVPEQLGSSNYVDGDKHSLSVGAGFELSFLDAVLPRPIRWDLALRMIIVAERVVEKRDPADLIGDYRSDGRILGFSTTLGFEF